MTIRKYTTAELIDTLPDDYTPPPYSAGNWRFEIVDRGHAFTNIGEPVCTVGGKQHSEPVEFLVGPGCDFGPHGAAMTEANARLIAASPDLFEACQAAASFLQDGEPSAIEVQQQIAKAIDKAQNAKPVRGYS